MTICHGNKPLKSAERIQIYRTQFEITNCDFICKNQDLKETIIRLLFAYCIVIFDA